MCLTTRKPRVGCNIPKKSAARIRLQQCKEYPGTYFNGLDGLSLTATLGSIDARFLITLKF